MYREPLPAFTLCFTKDILRDQPLQIHICSGSVSTKGAVMMAETSDTLCNESHKKMPKTSPAKRH